MYSTTLEKLGEAMKKNIYPSQMTSDIQVLMPKDVLDRFMQWIVEKDKDEIKGKHAYMQIAVLMKCHLSEIDEQIKNFLE